MFKKEQIKPKGDVEIIIEHKNKNKEFLYFKNEVLNKGKEALAASLGNQIDDEYDFFINRILFGTNGTSGGVPKQVVPSRTGLFGTTLLTKPVIAAIDTLVPSQIIFTAVIPFDEGNSSPINEMALEMNNGELYSMTTFADLNKTSSMQFTFNWRLSFV